MKEKIDKEQLRRFFSGAYSEEDTSGVEEVFQDDSRKEALETFLLSEWHRFDETTMAQDKNLDHILHKLYYKFQHQQERKKEGLVIRLWNTYSRVAALLLIPLALTLAFLLQQDDQQLKVSETWAEIEAPLGSRVKFTLPDGSVGWLNSGSFLTYPIKFGNERNVKLTGEAFFDIKKDPTKPFNVVATDLNISVLGTRFNVAAYKDVNEIQVVLESGKVKLNHIHGKNEVDMDPNDKIIYNSDTRKLVRSKVDPYKYSSWTEGKLVFRNDDIAVVGKRLGRWYNMDVEVRNEKNRDLRLRATFENEAIEEVLRLLKISFPIEYEVEKRKMDLNGKYEKRKVIITVR
ncbi:DUF4974 domain-containing protein [Fulvivirgaceae bacterium BMA12]|uniref:DUF4974 domain-containing protein n=1 Tax=Agaribacillus aureus TaxID=3051825 RepID=A0ABT8L7I0_9BACT|nr:DUF4974 domain-containing protein [Fulvivirgaceae bacterium BMA12]